MQKNNPERILYINGGTMDMGGISAYMMNYYRHMDKEKIQIDFVVHGNGGVFNEEIEKSGGRVFHLPTKRQNYFASIHGLNEIMKNGNYKIVHSHADGMNGLILKKARKYGIPVRISHSHNTEHLTQNKIRLLYHEYARKQIPKYATHLWACSKKAGEWLYGSDKKFEVIPNAIETDRFAFDPGKRECFHEKFGLKDKFVIGHIGKFEYQKNQEYLIEIFPEILKQRSNAVLVLIGDGENRRKIEQQILAMNLEDKVLLLGRRSDVNELLNMFDVFVMPSRFEGLGFVFVEAQTNGLYGICSDQVTEESDISGTMKFISLKEKEQWVSAIVNSNGRMEHPHETVANAGYDIVKAAEKLQKRYLDLCARNNIRQ